MFSGKSLFCAFFVAFASNAVFLISELPAKASSSLAAWTLERSGVLKLRTSKGIEPKVFFQSSDAFKGDRVWIDFPGELIRPRALSGTGPIKEIRLGKPSKGITRFVVEFKSSISLDPSNLKLEGVKPDLWHLDFVDIPLKGLKRIGEGNLIRPPNRPTKLLTRNTGSIPSRISDLPIVPKGRFRVVIDPGHGGPDSGAVGIRGIRETDVVLDISLQISRILEQRGVNIYLTRRSEIDLDLPPRVAKANQLGADAFVSVHANASRGIRRDVNGIETFYFAGSRGFKLASFIQNEILKVSPGSPDRGVRRGRFFVIRRTIMPAVLVETGFLTGRLDASRLAKFSHRKNLAFAISKGILLYLKEAR